MPRTHRMPMRGRIRTATGVVIKTMRPMGTNWMAVSRGSTKRTAKKKGEAT